MAKINNNNELNQIYNAILGIGDALNATKAMANKIRDAIEYLARIRYQANKDLLGVKLSGALTIPSLEKSQAFVDSLNPLADRLNALEKDILQQNQDINKLHAKSEFLGNANLDPKIAAQIAEGERALINTSNINNQLASKAEKKLGKLALLTADVKNMTPSTLEKIAKTKDKLNLIISEMNEHNKTMKDALRKHKSAVNQATLPNEQAPEINTASKSPKIK